MQSILRPALVLFGALTLVCGLAYPALVTGIVQAAFSDTANGSLVTQGDRVLGSRLIGQDFNAPQYFRGRPSATAPTPNNGAGSSGSNQGPLNPALLEAVKARIAALRAADPANRAPIPADLVSASASGLDPEISLAGARWQAARVAKARGIAAAEMERIISEHARGRMLGLFGEPRVNVLALNLALDAQTRDTR